VPEGWILYSLTSEYDGPTLVYEAILDRRDQYGSSIEFTQGNGPTPEAAISDAANKARGKP
jgi:hypothetical protein